VSPTFGVCVCVCVCDTSLLWLLVSTLTRLWYQTMFAVVTSCHDYCIDITPGGHIWLFSCLLLCDFMMWRHLLVRSDSTVIVRIVFNRLLFFVQVYNFQKVAKTFS
jgi:hypothetical protein